MRIDDRTEYVTRDTIMRLLSDDEVARVATAETAPQLVEGEEYIDLEEPDRGVRRAQGNEGAVMGRMLPRKAVLESTWHAIEVLLASHREVVRSVGVPAPAR